MKRVIIFLLFVTIASLSYACTTFCINNNGQIVFGRNYDWITGAGIIHTNHRGLLKTSMLTGDGKQLNWVSKYGSITFNQYGKEHPMGGMNEKGLVVELMWLDETVYPAPDIRPSIGVLNWIQYQLDNASTTAEVIASDQNLRITSRESPLHYLIADAAGNVASIEFLNGKMVVHAGKHLPFPALTNSTYNESKLAALKRKRVPENNSLDRFVKACNMIGEIKKVNLKTSLTDYAFSILENVAQGDYTKWSIVYDITNRKISFRTSENSNIRSFDLSGFDYSCITRPKMYDMNNSGSGNIQKKFIADDHAIKKAVLQKAVEESRSRVRISDAEMQAILKYGESINCR